MLVQVDHWPLSLSMSLKHDIAMKLNMSSEFNKINVLLGAVLNSQYVKKDWKKCHILICENFTAFRRFAKWLHCFLH